MNAHITGWELLGALALTFAAFLFWMAFWDSQGWFGSLRDWWPFFVCIGFLAALVIDLHHIAS